MKIADHVRRVFAAGGDLTALSAAGQTLSWSDIAAVATGLSDLLGEHGVEPDMAVGLLGRNSLEAVSGLIALMAAGRAVVLINAQRPVSLIADELKALGLAALVSGKADVDADLRAAATVTGTLLIEMSCAGSGVELHVAAPRGAGPFRRREAGALIEIQTSGTTGAPKRISIAEATLAASLSDGVRTATGAVTQTELKPRRSPTLMFSPLVHTSGTFNALMSVFEVRPIVLFEKFDPEAFRQALVRYRPAFAPLPPTALRMMLDSDATAEDFQSVAAVRAGTAPLSPEVQAAFEARFDTPVLTTYGATEFMGAATSWTLDDHRRFGVEKRGSVGRPGKGVEIRIVDPQTGAPLETGEAGLLEARLDRIDQGRSWIRTTDLARLDSDGFLFILGRTDDAIIRGGFKVMAGKVADVLRTHPDVLEAMVVGRPDKRLGEVPVAAVELRRGHTADPADLKAFAKARLTPYETPVAVHIFDQLPRTVSDKVIRPEVIRLLEGVGA